MPTTSLMTSPGLYQAMPAIVPVAMADIAEVTDTLPPDGALTGVGVIQL